MTKHNRDAELARINETVEDIALEYDLNGNEYDELAFWAANDILTEIMTHDELISTLMGYVWEHFLNGENE